MNSPHPPVQLFLFVQLVQLVLLFSSSCSFSSSRWQKRTKTSILCSKSQKMGVPDPKSAQKPRFCARKARKRGFRRPKKHKNPDFVLEIPENGGSGGQKSTKTSILCSKALKTGVPKAKSAQKPRFCARNTRKRGSRRPNEHKNPDFVLGETGIGTRKRGN